MMPRLYLAGIRQNFTAQRIVAPCNRLFDTRQTVSDHHDRPAVCAVLVPFHNEGISK